MTTETISVSIPASRDAAHRARTVISSVLEHDPRGEDVKLATSELVSNAVKHARLADEDEIRLQIRNIDDRLVRVGISYRGSAFVKPEDPATSGGYGLRIVDALATRWDIDRHDEIITAWFEI